MYWDWEHKSSLSICRKQRNEFSPGLTLDPGVQNICHLRLETSLKYPCVLSLFRLFATTWIVAGQAPLSLGFSRQEYSLGYQKSKGTVPAWAGLEGFAFQLERQESHQGSGAAKD